MAIRKRAAQKPTILIAEEVVPPVRKSNKVLVHVEPGIEGMPASYAGVDITITGGRGKAGAKLAVMIQRMLQGLVVPAKPVAKGRPPRTPRRKS